MYLGHFLAYIDPIYHFGIVKVCTLSIQIDKSIIIVDIRNAMKYNIRLITLPRPLTLPSTAHVVYGRPLKLHRSPKNNVVLVQTSANTVPENYFVLPLLVGFAIYKLDFRHSYIKFLKFFSLKVPFSMSFWQFLLSAHFCCLLILMEI